MKRKILLIIAIALVVTLLASLILGLAFEIRDDDGSGSSSNSSSSDMNQSGSSDQSGSNDQPESGSNDQMLLGEQTMIAGAYVKDANFIDKYCSWEYMVRSYELYIDSESPYYAEQYGELCAIRYDVIVPDDVTYVAMFDANSIVFPATTTSIGYVYTSCNTIYIKATTPPALLGNLQGEMMDAPPKIVVPVGCGEVYKSTEGWSVYADYIVEGKFDFLQNVYQMAIPQSTITVETDEGNFLFNASENYINANNGVYQVKIRDKESGKEYMDGDGIAIENEFIIFQGQDDLGYPIEECEYLTSFNVGNTKLVSEDVYAFFYIIGDDNYSQKTFLLVDGKDAKIFGKMSDGSECDLSGVNYAADNLLASNSLTLYLSFPLKGELSEDGAFDDGMPSLIRFYMFCGKIMN